MRQVLLASTLIAAAVGLFTLGEVFWPGPGATGSLGDLSAMEGIVADVTKLADAGDIPAAQARITDLETAWDEAEPTMRPLNPEAWGFVDDAADTALAALRAGSPDAGEVKTALTGLTLALADPTAGDPAAGGVGMVGDVAVTDASGHPLPCEAMLADVTASSAATPQDAARAAKVADLVAKATERCNADDDARSDAFSAAALMELAKA